MQYLQPEKGYETLVSHLIQFDKFMDQGKTKTYFGTCGLNKASSITPYQALTNLFFDRNYRKKQQQILDKFKEMARLIMDST